VCPRVHRTRELTQLKRGTFARRVDVTSSEETSLEVATQADAQVLSNLLELYIHDVCDLFPSVELGPDGRFGYPKLPLYWSDPEHRFAYLVRHGGRVAGFVLATRGSPVTVDPDVFDVAEFFVNRRYRRLGVGRRAAFLLWKGLPGKWTVRVSDGNRTAVSFWSGVAAEFTSGKAVEDTRPGEPNAWRVFSFETAP
jgi:predicted acetyltransferase